MCQAVWRVLSEPVVSSGRHPGEVQAAVIPIQQTWTLRLREAGPVPRLAQPAVRCGRV